MKNKFKIEGKLQIFIILKLKKNKLEYQNNFGIKFKKVNAIKFSVILPTYNCDFWRSIDSVINQNYKFWELIVIDNDSKNNVLKIIKKKRIKNQIF